MSELGIRIEELDTPALLVDLDKVEANLERAAAIARSSGVALRPHTKTHKSPFFARQQLALGARGITVAKVGEAEVMAEAGLTDLFIANTVIGAEKGRRLRALTDRATVSVGVDHLEQARSLSAAMADAAGALGVVIEVDTGGRRGGVQPDDAAALAREVAVLPGLSVQGVYAYEGFLYAAQDLADLVAVQRTAQLALVRAGRAVGEALGLAAPVISAGTTPGLFSGAGYVPGITEIRPGTYIFLDAAQASLAGGLDRCAAHVLATVVSRPAPGRAILDTGSKSLTSDTRASGVCKTSGYGLLPDFGLTLARLSEEHGVVDSPAAERLQVGQKVRVLPNHICPVVNLFDQMVLVRGDRVDSILPVAGRGRLQ